MTSNDIKNIVSASAVIVSSAVELLSLIQKVTVKSQEISEADRQALLAQIIDIKTKVENSKFTNDRHD